MCGMADDIPRKSHTWRQNLPIIGSSKRERSLLPELSGLGAGWAAANSGPLLYAQQCICILAHMDAFQTLADRTRRQIVETLRSGEQQVNDIVDALDIHQSGVSRHLRLLLEAGFVQVRPVGQHRLYSLRPAPFRELEAWIASYQRLWDARLDRFGAALEKRRSANTKGHRKEKKRDD
jgi:DNA-binding transcriptional ArsR family regulator